jgi:hypothetical protein
MLAIKPRVYLHYWIQLFEFKREDGPREVWLKEELKKEEKTKPENLLRHEIHL